MTTKPQSTTETLEPCPFCGSRPETGITGAPECDNWRYVKCSNNYCSIRHSLFTVKTWNTRISPASTAPVVDEQWVKLLAKAISTAKPTLMPERDNLTHYVISPEAFAALAQVHRAIAKRLWGAAATAAPVEQSDASQSCQRCGRIGGKIVNFNYDSITTSRWICPHCLDANEGVR